MIIRPSSFAYGGLAIGRLEGKVVMIKGGIPGELLDICFEKEKKDYYTASVSKVIEPSPERITPACKFAGVCGGCQLQHISYNKQVQFKEQALSECLTRLSKIDADLSSPIFREPWNYRFRGQFKIDREKIGFFREKTREIIDIDNCPLMAGETNKYLLISKRLLKNVHLKEIHISVGDVAVGLIKSGDTSNAQSYWRELASMFMTSGFSGIWIEHQNGRILKYGLPYTTFNLADLQYTVSPMSFFQSHWRLNQEVVKFLMDSLQPLKGKRVLDLYSGAGNFSILLSGDAEAVTGIEENPYAIEDGKRNLRVNGIGNCKFIHAAAEDFDVNQDVDILLIDPPRSGITNRVMNKILSLTPETIAYISCNPATLARDLKKLLAKYSIESIRMIDFFPQTYHIESLTFLRLR